MAQHLDAEADGQMAKLAEQRFEPLSRGVKNTSARTAKEISRSKWEARHAEELREREAMKKKQSKMRSGARDAKCVQEELKDANSEQPVGGVNTGLSRSEVNVPDRQHNAGAKAMAERLMCLKSLPKAADKRRGVLRIMKMGSKEHLSSSELSDIVSDLQARGFFSDAVGIELITLLQDVLHDEGSAQGTALPPEQWLEHAKMLATAGARPSDEKLSANEIRYLKGLEEKKAERARLQRAAWKDAAPRKPTWDVPTSIKITSTPKYQEFKAATYYHAPAPFNVDVYKMEGMPLFIYYVARPEKAGWRFGTTGTDWRGGDADPTQQEDGNVSVISDMEWRGDGSHYLAQGDPPWMLEFSFEHNVKSRVRVDWDRWDETGGSKKEVELLPVSTVEMSDVEEGLGALLHETDFHHIRAITCETPTSLSHDIVFLDNARIPVMTLDTTAGDTNSAMLGTSCDSDHECAGRQPQTVVVSMLSGVVATLDLPPPCSVKLLKERLAKILNIHPFLQQIMDGPIELADSDAVSVGSVLLIRKDPPMTSTTDFLQSMLYCSPAKESRYQTPQCNFRRWYEWDIYGCCPADPEELLAYFAGEWCTESVPMTTENILGCFDIWLGITSQGGSHPETCVEDIDKLVAFFEHYCYSPSLYKSHMKPLARDDSIVYVFFMVGRLRHASQTLLVTSIYMDSCI